MEKEFEVAAKWWADCLRNPPPQNNGDSIQSGMMTMLSEMKGPIPEINIQKFQDELFGWLIRERSGRLVTMLDVDYGPCRELCDATAKAGIDFRDFVFPVKTIMWIKPGMVQISCGYGSPVEAIYKKDNGDEKDSD